MIEETVTETLDDGTRVERPATRWRNTSMTEVVIPLFIGTPAPLHTPDVNFSQHASEERRTGVRTIKVPPQSEILIAREHDCAIRTLHCRTCNTRVAGGQTHARSPNVCRNIAHANHWECVGGLAPSLVRVDPRVPAVPLAPAIDATRPVASPVASEAERDARLLARARRTT